MAGTLVAGIQKEAGYHQTGHLQDQWEVCDRVQKEETVDNREKS